MLRARQCQFTSTFFVSQLLSAACVMAFVPSTNAATVSKVKGEQILLTLDSEGEVSEGSKHFLMAGTKRRATITVTKVKGFKASAKVTKGRADIGQTTEPMGAQFSSRTSEVSPKPTVNRATSLSIGVLGGYSLDTQAVVAKKTNSTDTEAVSMTGSGFSLKLFVDLPIAGRFGLIGRGGVEQFNVNANASVGAIKTEILYGTADLLVRFRILEGSFAPFFGAGLGLHFPLSKTSDVLDIQRVSTTSVFFFNAGADISLSRTMYLQILGEYGLFPPSNDVKTNFIAVRGGLGLYF